MNRSIALFVGLVVLLAHVLAIFNDGGVFATTYDRAYAAARLARNLVHEGVLRWNPNDGPFESYGSMPWALWIAVAERVRIAPNTWAQITGMISALGTVVVLSRFYVERTASVIGPLLLVVSGGLAAAAACGTETATLTLILTVAFLAFERGSTRVLAAALALACATRADGAWIAAGMLALFWIDRPRASRPLRASAFLAPALAILASWIVRKATTGAFLSPSAAAILDPRPGQWSNGLAYLRDFAVTSASPLLAVFPIAYLALGRLSQSGRHALLLAALWSSFVLLQGGGALPFCEAMVPALPFFFHAIQEGMTQALDSARPWVRRTSLGAFLLALVFSGLASTFPADRGPLRTEAWHLAWMEPSTTVRPSYEETRGRLGLAEEIRLTKRLRAVGLYMRDNLDPSTTVLAPWPGSIAYLSRLRVLDLLGRATPAPGERRPAPWDGPRPVDTLAWLERRPDVIVPSLYLSDRAPSQREIAEAWLRDFDSRSGEPGRRDALEAALGAYELITVPIYVWVAAPDRVQGSAFYLLRRRDLALRPKLEVTVEGRRFSVLLQNRGHRQLADLSVLLENARGEISAMRPTGVFEPDRSLRARIDLLIYPSGARSIELAHGELPADAVRVRAVLLNPGSTDDREFWTVSDAASAPVN